MSKNNSKKSIRDKPESTRNDFFTENNMIIKTNMVN